MLILGLCSLLVRGTIASAETSLVGQLRDLVEINSGSGNSEGVAKVQQLVGSQLKTLGFGVNIGSNRLLVARLAGNTDKTVTLLVHADTVFEPKSQFQHFVAIKDTNRATGPGVIDDKGGIVVALDGLKRFLQAGKPKFSIVFVSSPAEEIGSPGLFEEFKKIAKQSWLILGFEPALENGSVIQSRRGGRWYHVTVDGKEAHAGRAHKQGINACNELARKISEISKLTNYDRNVTVSIGHMEGGQDKYNIVCGKAEAKIDTRFSSTEDRDALHRKIETILKWVLVKGAQTRYEIVDDTPPLLANAQALKFVEKYTMIVGQIENRKIVGEISGGAGDINYFAEAKAITIDGLGPVGGNMHTDGEFIDLSSLETRSEALNQFLSTLQ